MRISNVLVTSAVIVTLVTLVVYDFFIRQVYTSGDYKIPYYHYTNCSYRDFDRVDVLSSTIANVKFIQ
ncbi:MAG: hypothetical protein ABUT20_36160, partial [Bacteroidota bacterium]